jgi:multiple sugar transport system substrate-binding protein
MKKLFFAILLVSLAAGALLAAGGQQGGQSPGAAAVQSTPTLVNFWDENPGPDRTPYLEEIIKWYHEGQNKVQVKYVGVPQAQFLEKLNVAIAGNSGPDISGMRNTWVAGLIAQKALMRLDDVFAAWSERNQFDSGSIEAIRKRDIVNGGLYFLPVRTSLQCLWYRVDRFKEAGVEAPQTWDEFFNAIAKLTDPAKGQYGFAIRGGSGSAMQLLFLLLAYSGHEQFFDQNGAACLRDQVVVDFLTRFAGIYNKYTAAGDVNYNYQAMVAAFDSGAANMIQHNIGSLGEHKKSLPDGTYAALYFPRSVKGPYESLLLSPAGYSVYDGSKVKDASVDFLKFLCSERAISYWNEKIGEFPPRLDVLQHDWVKNAAHLKNIVGVMQDPKTIYTEHPQYLPEWDRILTEIGEPGFQEVLLGRKTAAAFLNEWAEALEQANKRFIANTKK